jgi:HK97 family phage major capsid protein
MAVSLAVLTQRRAKIREQMLEMQRRAEADDPDNATMSPEAQSAFDALKAALADLETAISNRAAVDAFERHETGTTLQAGDGKWQIAKRNFRTTIALAGAAGLRVDDGPEREVSAELAKRSGRKVEGVLLPWESFHKPIERRVVSPLGSGAGIIGTYLDETQYVDALRAHVICANLGARYMTGLERQTDFPRLSNVAVAQWVADGSPANVDTQEAFDKISLRPHTIIGLCEFTRAMLLTSTPAVQDACRNDLVQVLARAIDLAALAGSGTVDPLGILNQAGLTIVPGGTNGAALSWPGVLSLVEAVQLQNAPETALGWAGNPRVRAAGMGTLKFPAIANGAGTIMEGPDSLAGYPFQSTTQLVLGTKGTGTGLSTLIYGSWNELLIAMFGEGVEALINPYGTPQFASGNVQVRVIATADIAVKHVQSFAAMTDIAAP